MIKIFPILYSRNTNGSVQQWQIEVDGSRYRTSSGKKDGAIVVTAWTDCEAKNVGKKNEVSPDAQALKEAEAKFKDQIKTGYREDINEIDNLTFHEPMRAKPFAERLHKVTYPGDAQYKLDGFRANPQPDTNVILSRYNNLIVGVPHLNDLLGKFHAKHPDIRLDGELYSHAHKDDFNTICSMLRKQTPTAAEIQACKVMELWVFDLIDLTLPWEERFERLKEIWKEWHPVFGRSIRLVWTTRCNNRAEYDAFHLKATSLGFEGSMWRDLKAKYEYKRTDSLLKRKDFQDKEFEVVDFLPGRGNKAGMAAKVLCYRDSARTVTFEANIVGDWTFCKHLLEHKAEYIGAPATIKFTNYTPPRPDGTGSVPRQGEMIKINKF